MIPDYKVPPGERFKRINNEMFMNGSCDSESHRPLMTCKNRVEDRERNFQKSKEDYRKKAETTWAPWSYNKASSGRNNWKDYVQQQCLLVQQSVLSCHPAFPGQAFDLHGPRYMPMCQPTINTSKERLRRTSTDWSSPSARLFSERPIVSHRFDQSQLGIRSCTILFQLVYKPFSVAHRRNNPPGTKE